MEVEGIVLDDRKRQRRRRAAAGGFPHDVALDHRLLKLTVPVLDDQLRARHLAGRNIPQDLLARARRAGDGLNNNGRDVLLLLFLGARARRGRAGRAADDGFAVLLAPAVALSIAAHQKIEMVHAILNLNHAATIIDGVGHAVKRRTGALHGDFRPERYRRRRSTGMLARVKSVSQCVKKPALHGIIRRIVCREQRLYSVRCRAARLRAGILGKRITRGNVIQRVDGRAVLVHTEMQVTAG